jgi:predicted TIM-barrel fold metal-dependent hydrolase
VARIAIEEHWILPELDAALGALPTDRRDESLAFNDVGDHRQRLEDLDVGRIAAMDAQGIDLSIIALTPPGTQALSPADAVRLSRAANDTSAAAVSRHPSRLRSLSTLPMSAPEEVAAELERAARLGHVGTMVYGRSGDFLLDDPVYDEFFSAAMRLSQPVFIHPQLPSPALRDASYRGFDPPTELALATFGWGWHLDAALAALRLIIRGTFDRHPDLQIVLGHWGEMLLFWLDRADSLSRIAGLQRSVSEYVQSNFWITASGMLDPALLQHVLSVTSIDRLIFSTDYPFQLPTHEQIDSFLGHFTSDEDRHKFSSANAEALFGLGAMGPPGPTVRPASNANGTTDPDESEHR